MIEGGLRLKGHSKSNENNDLFSIITIVFNGELHIEETIKSVFNQNYRNIEYIIIDGGSTDRTLEILKKYDSKIDYWLSEHDTGISNAFNKGIALVQGEIIGIINSDDYYKEGVLANIMSVYNYNDPCVLCGGMLLKHPQRPDRIWNSTLKGIEKEMTIAHPATFVPRTIYTKFGGFDEDFKIAMDYEFVLRLMKANVRFQIVPYVTTIMRAGGVSSKRYLQGIKEMNLAHKKYFTKKMFFANIIFLRFRFVQSLGMKFFDKLKLGYFVGSIFKRKTFDGR